MFWRKSIRLQTLGPGARSVAPEIMLPADAVEAAEPPEPEAATQDVACGYRLFHGREAESAAVLAERAGQPVSDMLYGFLGSEEFRAWSIRVVSDPMGVGWAFRAPPVRELLDWACGFFALTDEDGRGAAAESLLALIAVVLAQPSARTALEQAYGATRAASLTTRLALAARNLPAWEDEPVVPPAPDPRVPDAAGEGITAGTVRNLYALLLDRAPESDDVAMPRLGQSFIDRTIEFLISKEFHSEIVPGVLDGRLAERAPLAPALVAWAGAAFEADLGEEAGRRQALAAALRHPSIRDRLEGAHLAWSMTDVLHALAGAPAEAGADPAPADRSFRLLLAESGLFDARWYLTRNVDLRRAGIDAIDHFIDHGAMERRDPGPGFDTHYYVEQTPEIEGSGLSAVEHYLRVGRTAGVPTRGPSAYERWARRFQDLTDADRERIAGDAAAARLPTVTCVHIVPASATCPESVAAALSGQIGTVAQVRVVASDEDVARAAQAIAAMAAGSVVVLSGDGAVLRPHACYAFANILARGPAAMAYSDHDHLDAAGLRTGPVFKPAMSPDFMAREAYAGPLVAVLLEDDNRARVAAAIAGAREDGAAAAFARLLLATDPARVARVPLPLYALPREAGLGSEDDRADVHQYEPVPTSGIDHGMPVPVDAPRVSILIPTRDRRDILQACIDSIFAETDYPRDRLQVMVIDNDSSEPESLAYLALLAARPDCAVVASPGPFNFAKICNDGVAATDAEMLVFMNNDMTVREPGWLLALVSNAMRPEIGVVGAQLLYPDDTVQHGGVIIGLGGVAGHRLLSVPADEAAHLDATREMTAMTGACIAIRRAVFAEAGGFDPVLGVAFNDVVLCMDVVEAGYRNLYIARPLLYHYESKSRGLDDTDVKIARNMREAIYTRERYERFFRDDPSYNPNLSLNRAGALAAPPRVLRPWRRSAGRRILLLSSVHGIGHGVGCVVAMQADYLLRHGWDVTIGGGITDADRSYPGCARMKLATAEEAASYAVAEGFDCVIAHTPPFFSVGRWLGRRPLFYFHDHGEPPPALFADRRRRQEQDWEKRFCAPLARRVFAISRSIHDQQFRRDAIVLRNGNTHLSVWSREWAGRRERVRRRYGLEGKFLVLNVCRFHEAERSYKGVDDYMALAAELPFAVPALAGRAVFALAGRGDDEDIAFVRSGGVAVFPNVPDEEMADLYAAADLYVNLSQWEGYNLGIGQALAMGLDVIASDIPVHREFGVTTAGSLPMLCAAVADAFARRDEAGAERTARIEHWDEPLARMAALLEQDLAEDAAGPWL